MDPPNKYNAYMKSYYHKNKAKINQKVTCEICNVEINKRTLSRHNQSNKHLNKVNSE